MSEPTYDVIKITPQLAAMWLIEHNTHNRPMRRRVVAAYAEDIRSGNWRQTGDSIKRAADGTILDGQHRLAAIVEAQKSITMLVVGNLPAEVQDVVDGGARRKFGDVLQLRGEKNYVTLAAVVRRVWYWNTGLRTNTGNYSPSTSQLLALLEEHPELRDSVEAIRLITSSSQITGSILGLTHWLFSQIDAEDAKIFFARVGDGVNLAADHPVYVLRKTVADHHTAKSRLTDTMVIAYTIKAWNAYRDGRTISILRYRAGGASPEAFPEPK